MAQGNIQEHSFLPEHLGCGDKREFWSKVGDLKRNHDADEILMYMHLMLDWSKRVGAPLTRDILRRHGASIPFYAGVESWFSRIDHYAAQRGLALEHYVVSSGNEEIIGGSSIRRVFKKVFASRFMYDSEGEAMWPAVVVNYTTKTQFLFRINKGVDNSWDNAPVNRWIPMSERRIPFERMIYLGDGDTDIPSMKMVRHQGGQSVAVFDPGRWNGQGGDADLEAQRKVYKLISEDRAHFVVPADYTEGSQLDVTVKGVLGRIARDAGYRGPD